MFIADEIVLDAGFPAAQARLVNLARRGGLAAASAAAYADGLSAVIRVGRLATRPVPPSWSGSASWTRSAAVM
jgi:hypothetical protein